MRLVPKPVRLIIAAVDRCRFTFAASITDIIRCTGTRTCTCTSKNRPALGLFLL
jgi:hypothetical protein